MNPNEADLNGGASGCGCGINRRELLQVAGLGSLALLAGRLPVMAGPFEASDFQKQLPTDKKLQPDWVKSLFERGAPAVYRGAELEKIGMPVGGIGAGQLYLGGDGRLWQWDIFNQHIGTGDDHYAHPPPPASPLEQGFALQIAAGGQTATRALDRSGFSDIRFRGEYPIGTVEYRDPASPVVVSLEAFSPFIPLATDDSSLPATILNFTVHNTSSEPVEVTLTGWLENAVCRHSPWAPAVRRNRIVRGRGFSFLECAVEKLKLPDRPARADVVFEDWNKDTYAGWTVEGTAFGAGPIQRSAIPEYQGDVDGDGERVVNSHASAPGQSVEARDAQTGKLTSRRFTIERQFLQLWIGGGAHQGKTCLNLVVDGKVALSATGRDDNRMTLQTFDLHALEGKEAFIEIVDTATGGWGNIGVGKITFTDRPGDAAALEQLPDYGTMGLALLGAPPEQSRAAVSPGLKPGSVPDETHLRGLGKPESAKADFVRTDPGSNPGSTGGGIDIASVPLNEKLVGDLSRKLHLRPGESRTVAFVLTWHFPNLEIERLGRMGRHYATRFDSALAVARHVAEHFDRLTSQTRLWRETWYDSTLPYWFLDRTFLTSSVLATSTCYRLADGRFYAWEGVGCCPGTCTHVWHYAQAMARLFPELERNTRERVDFGLAFHPDSGVIGFRAEFDPHLAVDGQAGTILRAYREHQMSPDNSFLKRNWPRIRKAFDPLLQLDGNDDGLLEGAQMNTLDQPWYGRIAWLSSLYVAAVRAGEAMAREIGETPFAERCRAIAERGARNIDAQLFNGEYYIQRPDEAHAKSVGSHDGCEIDQVFGDSWARQVGLGRVLPEPHVKRALASLWTYNFTPDVGPFRAAHKPGRWFALAGEGGLLMCSWPKGEGARVSQGYDFYFNECMTGFEYQVAGHMIGEGMLLEGLAVTRAIHDRYHPSRRNPWNEVECGDHYARSMASYGVFLAACGYEHHGPNGHLAFAPKLTPEDFKAAFTAAEGWGSFAQKMENGKMRTEIALHWGQLRLKTLALQLPPGVEAGRVRVTLDGRAVGASRSTEGRRLTVTMAADVILKAGQKLEVRASSSRP